MGRAYVFSMEALLAIVIFLLFFSAVLNFYVNATESFFPKIAMKRIGIDVLDSLDNIDVLESLDTVIISEKIDKELPPRLGWKLTITQYAWNKDFFETKSVLTAGDTGADLSAIDSVKVKRLFLTFASGNVHRYNTAELWVWLK